jgi:asparagine synthase (glutamine-hydrolysing)
MCGIVGLSSPRPLGPERTTALAAMCDRLAHRGPDDAGTWITPDRRVALGHRRLAIIDLSPAGHQPMQSADGRFTIAFNGEIYNYREIADELRRAGVRLVSSSDTEVVLAAWARWGEQALARVDGMFAFALHDADAGTLTLARDRVGEKPLFYRHADGALVFASELKALLKDARVPARLDIDSLDEYLAYGYVSGARTMVEGVHKLPPGHRLVQRLGDGRVDVAPYWTLPESPPPADADLEATLDRLETLMLESVRLRLTASDVPVGILLSGGLDSSLVTAVAARVSDVPVRTFSVTFPGHGVYDESAHARLVAAHVGARHTELALEPATVDLLPELARIYDDPIADSSMVPTYLVSQLIRREATVALGGDGGDELFGGYPHYQWLAWQQTLRRWLPGPARAAAARGAARLPLGTRGRNHLIGMAGSASWALAHVNIYFDHRTRSRLLASDAAARRAGPHEPERRKAAVAAAGTLLQRATRTDFLTYLPDDLLVKVDRASMAHALEVRCPWLDHRVVEFAFRDVPDRFKVHGDRRKILLQAMAGRLLPRQFDTARKQGFSLPLHAWFGGPWGRFLREVLAEADTSLFRRPVIDELLAGQARGRPNMQRLYALAFFELWRRAYGVTH